MANQTFKLKSGLTLTPVDLTTLTNPQAGDLACDINDSNKIKRYDANATNWVEVGSGGIGGVDIFFVQDFESASLSSFTQTGLVLSQTDPLKGKVSALLTHQAAINQSFKQIIPVDRKFRGQTMVLRLDAKSNASAGNLVINIYDETNSANIVASEQLAISNDVNGTKSTVSFTIPETCASISYTITALPEAGSPVSRIDDIICELAETALLETAVTVPNITAWQGYTPTFQGFGTPTNVEFEWRQVGENVEIRGKFTSGTVTAVEARVGLPSGLISAGTSIIPSIQVTGFLAYGNAGAFKHDVLIEPSVSYLTFGVQDATRAGLTKGTGSSVSGNAISLSFFASVPCAGLNATRVQSIPLTQSGLVQEADSMIRVYGPNGVGSTANRVLRFLTVATNLGSDVTYADSSTNGGSFTVNTSGVYSISGWYVTTQSLTQATLGLTLNASGADLTTNVSGISDSKLLTLARDVQNTASTNSKVIELAWTGYLNSGDVLRFQNDGESIANIHCTVSYQGSLKQVSVNPNSKITIPTSELRMEGASSRGSTATVIARFDNVAKLRGDAFTVESDAVLGTRITMKKAGILNVSSTLYYSSIGYNRITRNQTSLISLPTSSSEILAASGAAAASSPLAGVSWTGNVAIGDVIRISTDVTPTSHPGNSLNLSFQEQEIQVSVSNTLPQFSESDLVVRAAGNAGQSITVNVTDIPFQTSFDSTGGAWNGTQFTVQEDGIYTIDGGILYSTNTTGRFQGLYLNGVLYKGLNIRNGASQDIQRFSYSDSFTKGQVLSIRELGVSGTLINNTIFHYLNISKVGKPNVTGVDVTPFVNVPQNDFAHARLSGRNTVSSGNMVFDTIDELFGNGILNVDTTLTYHRVTILKPCYIDINYGTGSASLVNNAYAIYLYKNGVSIASSQPGDAGSGNIPAPFVAFSGKANIGDVFTFGAPASAPAYGDPTVFVNLKATALSDQILTAPETFSTDTASLRYANASEYTLSTLANAPVGTYITFTYAANTNTRTQTTGTNRPSQTDADMNANGILLYTRAYNAASTSGNPSAIAIQIGKGLKGRSLDLYKSAGKVISGSLDMIQYSSSSKAGAEHQNYNEVTGILYIDAGINSITTTTSATFGFSDVSSQTSGYLVINASKNPALTGLGLNTVAARAINTSGAAIANATNVTLTYDANKTFDTLGALNASTGVFTCPSGQSGYYRVTSAVGLNNFGGNAGEALILEIRKNGSVVTSSDFRSVTTFTFQPIQHQVSDIVYLNAGDTLLINVFQNSGTALSLVSSAGYVYTAINKVGV